MDEQQFRLGGQRLMSWKRVLILTHDRPDGDALGASVAMKQVLEAAGNRAVAAVYSDVPSRFCFLDHACSFSRWQAGDPAAIDASLDGILIVDTCSWAQLEPVADYLRKTRLPKIIVDHHETRDELAGAGGDVLYLIDATAASACGILHAWCELMGWALNPIAAQGLFTGIATDTGWFRFPSTDGRTLRSAAALIESGVRPDIMYARLIESYSPARLRLMAEVLATLELHAGGVVAMMSVTKSMFERAGATAADTEDIVNEPMSVGTIGVSILFSDMGDGKIRVNLRSKSPEIAGRDLDVASVAGRLGGGGHRRAAGARVDGTLEQVKPVVLAAVNAALGSL